MRPFLHPTLVNGRTGDPALYLETLFERRAILFDLGDLSPLAPRDILRIEHVFVSHAHIDHFFGFDRLLRILVGREKTVHLYGPEGFAGRVRHKLRAYLWNLIDRYLSDLIFIVTDIGESGDFRRMRFRLKGGFADEEAGRGRIEDGVILADAGYRVSAAVLEHRTACLGFAVEETAHVNVWKNRLEARGLPVGQWLKHLKHAVLENRPDDYPIGIETGGSLPLGDLRDILTITPGQKIGYITDVADTPVNRANIVRLVRGADILFIEAHFSKDDVTLAAERAHLTTEAAGAIARAAGVRRVEPFHFSTRYEDGEAKMIAEVQAAFRGGGAA